MPSGPAARGLASRSGPAGWRRPTGCPGLAWSPVVLPARAAARRARSAMGRTDRELPAPAPARAADAPGLPPAAGARRAPDSRRLWRAPLPAYGPAAWDAHGALPPDSRAVCLAGRFSRCLRGAVTRPSPPSPAPARRASCRVAAGLVGQVTMARHSGDCRRPGWYVRVDPGTSQRLLGGLVASDARVAEDPRAVRLRPEAGRLARRPEHRDGRNTGC